MNTKPKYESSPLELNGLEELLDKAHLEVLPSQPNEDATESDRIYQLLEQLHKVHELVRDTSNRLKAAHTKLAYLSAVEAQQSRQIKLLSYYQDHASKAASLEEQLQQAIAENERLKQSWWHKLFARTN